MQLLGRWARLRCRFMVGGLRGREKSPALLGAVFLASERNAVIRCLGEAVTAVSAQLCSPLISPSSAGYRTYKMNIHSYYLYNTCMPAGQARVSMYGTPDSSGPPLSLSVNVVDTL